ncbi:phage tail protein I [Paracoccus sp. 22332]|uniref:phage tail protein I n=1 Tax=Paracoccus sp. 22332 TaxID=3453913 RepID=UPI003F85B730
MTDLLPSHSGPAEKALAGAVDEALAIPVEIATVWRPEEAPPAFLPWLAWALSVDEWDPDWPEDDKRRAISLSLEIHRHKGTVRAMRLALIAAGLGDAEIQEGWSANQFNGTFTRDGSRTRAPSDHWAEYRVKLARPMSISQAARARAALTAAAPARCHLKLLTFEEAALTYNGAVTRDGQYTRGIV